MKQPVLELISWGGDPDSERDATFAKAWLRAQYAETIRERRAGSTDKDWELIGNTFHRWIRDNAERVGAGDAEQNLRLITAEFPFFARVYRTILDASTSYTPGLEPLFYNAHNDFTWQPTVLLAPLVVGDDDETVRRKLAATATFLDIWVMRRASNYIRVGCSSVSYAMWSLCRDIRGKSLEQLVATLRDKLEADAVDVSFDGSTSRNRHGITELALNQFSRRYIYHLLARLTAFTEIGAGKPDPFATYVDRSGSNSLDIEHIWADNYAAFTDEFPTAQEFHEWRDRVAGLLLLPADVNRSLQDKPFEEKAPTYRGQNFFAASLTEGAYRHQPQFSAFGERTMLPFKPCEHFGKAEQVERRQLVLALANEVWSPTRLDQYLAAGS